MRAAILALSISTTLFTVGAFAQTSPTQTTPTTPQTTPQTTPRTTPQTMPESTRPGQTGTARTSGSPMNGTVRSYENGKTLELDENGTTHTYDLSNTETTYRIDPNVRVGGNVKVTERTDSKGHKTVTVTPAKGKD